MWYVVLGLRKRNQETSLSMGIYRNKTKDSSTSFSSPPLHAKLLTENPSPYFSSSSSCSCLVNFENTIHRRLTE